MKACVKYGRSKKSCIAAGHDYVSSNIQQLDDDVLSQIFARLPLEDVVRTRILSKAWNFKPFMYKLDIDDRHWKTANPQSFVNFLNTTLPSLERLTIFQLRCAKTALPERTNDFQRWISAALEHNLEILIVQVNTRGIILPCTLLNSTWLRHLSYTDYYTTLRVDHVKNIAPNLTQLQLVGVKIVSRNPSLTFTFPVLETLTLIAHRWLNVNSVEIHAPSLTAVMSEASLPDTQHKESDYSVVIVAPRVYYFHCGEMVEKITVTPSPSSVVSATLFVELFNADRHIRKQVGYRVRKLLNTFTSLENLILDGPVAKESRIAVPLCRHDKLKRLTMNKKSSPKLLLELLHAAPSLNFLDIWVATLCDYNYEALECIPACIISHLEEVVFNDFCPYKNAPAYHLANFIFKNALQLKIFRIVLGNWGNPKEEREKIINRLSTMPKCSTAQVIFHSPEVYNNEWVESYFMAPI